MRNKELGVFNAKLLFNKKNTYCIEMRRYFDCLYLMVCNKSLNLCVQIF